MKSMLIKCYLLIFILSGINTFAQNNLFEKVYQKGYADYEYKFLKRGSAGFAVFAQSIRNTNIPFTSKAIIHTCNDTGLILQQLQLDDIIPMVYERYRIIDWHYTSDGNYLVNYMGNGCDFGVMDSSLIFKLSPTGNLIWYKNGLIYGEEKTGLIKYLNQYLNYSIPSNSAPLPQNIKLMFCSQNGDRRPLAEFANNNYQALYSNDSSLFVIKQDSNQNEFINHIDTLGTTFHSFMIGTVSVFAVKRNFDAYQNKIAVSYNNLLYLLNDTLGLLHQQNFINNIISLQFDALGNTWALLQNGDLIALDTNLNILSTTNLQAASNNIFIVDWFNIDVSNNRIYYGGSALNKPFLKSMELSTFNDLQNSIDLKVTAIQITNASGTLSFIQPSASLFSLSYQFNVGATIKNTGNTIINKVFLNCSPQIGFYICEPPFLSKQFTNLNLLPGDSVTLFIGNYLDYGVQIPLTSQVNPYIRSNFCVWPTAPNDSRSHNTIQSHCQDVEIYNLFGVNINNLEALTTAIKLSPNPSYDRLIVELPWNYTPTEITIMDITGAMVSKYFNTANSALFVDVASLTTGIYFLQLSDGEKVVRKKFVKAD